MIAKYLVWTIRKVYPVKLCEYAILWYIVSIIEFENEGIIGLYILVFAEKFIAK